MALVGRMETGDTVTSKAAAHRELVDAHGSTPKLMVLAAGHGMEVLSGYQGCTQTDIVLRLKTGQVFYQPPAIYQGRGRPPKHGERFKVGDEGAKPDEQTIVFKGKQLRISVWHKLHYAKYSDVHGLILKLEVLGKDAQPLVKNPIWRFSTALNLKAKTFARAYLWRRSHELSYSFIKQHLGLNNKRPLKTCDNWYQRVALAMNLLLASRDPLQQSPDKAFVFSRAGYIQAALNRKRLDLSLGTSAFDPTCPKIARALNKALSFGLAVP